MKSNDRIFLSLLNWLLSFSHTFLTIIGGFIVTPLLLKWMGADKLGLFRAVNDWFAYLGIVDLCIIPAFAIIFLEFYKNGYGGLRDSLRVGARISFAITICLFPLGILFVLNLEKFVSFPVAIRTEAVIAGMILLGSVLMAPLNIFTSLLESAQEGYHTRIALTIQYLFAMSVSLIGVYRGWDLIGMASGALAGAAAYHTYNYLRCRKYLRLSQRGDGGEVSGERILKLGIPFAIAGIATKINFATDTIVAGKFLGAEMVAVFYLTQRLPQLTGSQVNAIAGASWAAMAQIRLRNDQELFLKRFYEVQGLMLGLGAVLISIVAAYNERFMNLWVGEVIFGGNKFTVLCAIAAWIACPYSLYTWLIDSAGLARHRIKVNFLGAATNIGLSLWWVQRWGIVGLMMATIVALLVSEGWYLPILLKRHFGVQLKDLIRRAGVNVALASPFVGMAWLFAHRGEHAEGWIALLWEIGVVSLTGLGYVWVIILGSDDRSIWLQRARKIVARFRPEL